MEHEKAEFVKLNINLIRAEQDILADLWDEYDLEIAQTILKQNPQTEVEYRIAELKARIEHRELYNKIMKKQNEVESYKTILENKDIVMEEYLQFKKDNKQLFDILDQLFKE